MPEETKVAAAKTADSKAATAKATAAKTAAPEAPAAGGDEGQNLQEAKKKLKPKKKVTLPTEMLDDAKSNDDKQSLVNARSEKGRNRMRLMIKNLLKDGLAPTKK